jgi:predicted dehydrogenase
LAQEVGANYVPTVSDACNDVDGVVIATPPSHRLELVREAAAAGVPRIRVEKPLALTWGHGAAMIAACKHAGSDLSVGHTTCWSAFAAVAKQCVEADKGPIVFTRLCDRAPAHRAATSVVFDLMSHDIALHRMARPDEWELGVPEISSITVDDADGQVIVTLMDGAVFAASWGAKHPARGVAGCDFAYDELGQRLDIGSESIDVSWDDALQRELIQWAVGNEFPAALGLEVVALCEQIETLIMGSVSGTDG